MNVTAHFNKIRKAICTWSSASPCDTVEQVVSSAEFQKIVAIERCRVNRNGGTFALIVFKLEKAQLEMDLLLKLVRGISQRARLSDQLGWYDHDHLGLILPETSALGAQKFISDLYALNPNGMPKPPVDLYTYPLQGNYSQSNYDR